MALKAFAMFLRRFLLLSILAVAGPVQAAKLIDLISGDQVDWSQRSNRLAVAAAIGSLADSLHAPIPNLSPEQEGRLQLERARINHLDRDVAANQLVAFSESPAFRIEKAKHGLSRILSTVECIQNRPALEYTCWIKLALELLDTDVFEAVLFLSLDHSVSFPKKQDLRIYTEKSAVGPDYFPRQYARGILEYIVAPQLNRREAKP